LHIIDPRTARPVSGKIAAWSLPPATELAPIDGAQADALSTAFMVMSLDEIDRYCSSDFGQGLRAIVILDEQDTQTYSNKVLRFGPWPESDLKPQNNTNHKE
jgi:thiamine biosynthesis lipoprotein ApbE